METIKKSDKLGVKELVAMGVGGMVGGGIFSVLGVAVGIAGHAAPIAFALGGIITLLTGWSYVRLGLSYRSDGGSFTYLENAFSHPNIAGIGGWLLLVGYVGTLALYAFTFGVYGSAMLGNSADHAAMPHLLASGVLLTFLGINLYGVAASGSAEDILVMVKVIILSLFGFAGMFYLQPNHLLPVFNNGESGVLMGAALIFVAYEGFELIPNAINEMMDPERDLIRGVVISIVITTLIYILVSLVAVGNLLPAEIIKYKEYALAVAAKPFLGQAGFMLISLGALLSTASAINATLFGTARLGMIMAREQAIPNIFSHRERTKDIPNVSLMAITSITLIFVNSADLAMITSFASSTFLLVFSAVNLAALKLHRKINTPPALPLIGLLFSLSCWIVLLAYLYQTSVRELILIACSYVAIMIAEFLFSERRIIMRRL